MRQKEAKRSECRQHHPPEAVCFPLDCHFYLPEPANVCLRIGYCPSSCCRRARIISRIASSEPMPAVEAAAVGAGRVAGPAAIVSVDGADTLVPPSSLSPTSIFLNVPPL